MKTRILWAFLVMFGLACTTAQNKPDKYAKASEALEKHFLQMMQKPFAAAVNKKKENLACEAFPVLEQFNKADLLPKRKPFETYLKMVLEEYGKKLNGLTDNIIKETSSDPNLSYLAAVSRSRRFKDFAEDVTGKKIFNIKKDDKDVLLDFYLNHPLKKPVTATAKGKKVASAKFSECYASTEHMLTPVKWKYPKVTWRIKTRVTITCDCEAENDPTQLNSAVFVYDAFLKGSITTTKIDFGKLGLASLTLESLSCCTIDQEPDEEEDPQMDPEMDPETTPGTGTTEPTSLPNQSIGVSGGIGLQQDLEEVTICLGAEYLFNVTDLGDSSLFVGGNAQFTTTSFMDFSNTWVQVGPTALLFTPINPSEDLQWTNGVEAGYVFGTNDNNGFKDDLTGITASVVTGLHIQIKDNLAISLIVPVVTHQNITRDAQDGSGSIEISDTSILLNKANPLKVGLRFGF